MICSPMITLSTQVVRGPWGDRAGNFTVQNSDFLLILGCRLNIRLVSYNWKSFAPRAFKVMVDVDEAEINKPTLSIDLPVHADLRHFLPLFDQATRDWVPRHVEWLAWCRERVARYPVVLPEYWDLNEKCKPLLFYGTLVGASGGWRSHCLWGRDGLCGSISGNENPSSAEIVHKLGMRLDGL